MGLIVTTAASLMLVYGGTAGVEVLLGRFATPEARAANSAQPVQLALGDGHRKDPEAG